MYFKTRNCNLGKFLEGLEMEEFGIFYGDLVYFMYGHWYQKQKKNLATLVFPQLFVQH
jgi:hypothetical protein